MGDQNPTEPAFIARRLHRVWTLSIAGVVPYALLVLMLSASPASLGWRPFGGSISLAIYCAVFLFAWPAIVATVYIRAANRGGAR
jgi:uncharacterized membrane protein (DUF485 family)